MTTTTPLTDSLLKSGSKTASRTESFLKERFTMYNVDSYGTYVDHTTVVEDLPKLPNCVGLFTFDAKLGGENMGGRTVTLLHADRPLPECDGWVVASTSRASAFSLAKALLDNGQQDQVITRLYGGQTSEITAYMDIFSGETETLLHLNHYFNRKYRISFPIDIRYTVRECDGSVKLAGQLIIPPGGNVVLDTRTMDLGEFKGYFSVELEVENLQSRVQPFIHFWADYLSDAGMCRNHQSGWAPWPGGTVFNRGYLPLDDGLEAIGSLYNANDKPIQPRALLHFIQNGNEVAIERDLAQIPAGHMSYQNYSEIFADVDLSDVNAAYILVRCDDPMHRPNHYISIKGKTQFIDTYHQTGGKARHWAIPSYKYSVEDIKMFKDLGMVPWTVRLPLLPASFCMDTYIGLLSPTLIDNDEYQFSITSRDGDVLFSAKESLDETSPTFLNISQYAKDKAVDVSQGATFNISPVDNDHELSHDPIFLFGFQHEDFNALATSFTGGSAQANLPYYIHARQPASREYDNSPLQISDHFGPGICNSEFDSLYIVAHKSLYTDYAKTQEYQLEIIDDQGRQHVTHRSVAPQSHDVFWLSDILTELGLPEEGSYTLWFKSYETQFKPYHLLYRKSDHALSLDDGSEGTLQKEPQIGDGKQNENANEILAMLRQTGLQKMLPISVKQKLYAMLFSK